MPIRDSITEYYDSEIVQLIQWINSDGHLRTDEELIEELLPELGFTRRGARIDAVIRYLLDRLRNKP